MHVPLVDHVIIGHAEKRRKPYYSFKEQGDLTTRLN